MKFFNVLKIFVISYVVLLVSILLATDNKTDSFTAFAVVGLFLSAGITYYAVYDMKKNHRKNNYKVLYRNDMRFTVHVSIKNILDRFKDFPREYRFLEQPQDNKFVFMREAEPESKGKYIENKIHETKIELTKTSENSVEVNLKLNSKLHFMDYNASLYYLKAEIIGMISN